MVKILCKIAELTVEIPTAGGMSPRCMEYQLEEMTKADIVLNEDRYRYEKIPNNPELVAYLESGFQFYRQLLHFNGMLLHASAVEMDGRAYLFSGPCGTGKSTHTQLWRSVYGDAAQVFNDDKPALRYLDGKWYAYGTPWCGKDGINQNKKVPLCGICFLKQAKHNNIRRLSPRESVAQVLSQTHHRFADKESLDLLLGHVDRLIKEIPIFELENRPETEAALLSYQTMSQAAREAGL